jgi:hypothetical protein
VTIQDDDSSPSNRTAWADTEGFKTSSVTPWWLTRSESDELDRRVHVAFIVDTSSTPPLAPLPTRLEECLPVVRRMAAQLKQNYRGRRAWPVAGGAGVFELGVSEGSQRRSLYILDRMLRHCRDCGLELMDDEKSGDPARLVASGQAFTCRLAESAEKEEIEQTPAWRAQVSEEPQLHHWKRDRYAWRPTGVFTVVFRPLEVKTIVLTLRGKDDQDFLERLASVPAQLKRVAHRLRIRDELRAEVLAHQEVQATANANRGKLKAAAQKKLGDYEEMAERLERAERLRRLASALEGNPGRATTESEWIRRAADWLDPTFASEWVDMDE